MSENDDTRRDISELITTIGLALDHGFDRPVPYNSNERTMNFEDFSRMISHLDHHTRPIPQNIIEPRIQPILQQGPMTVEQHRNHIRRQYGMQVFERSIELTEQMASTVQVNVEGFYDTWENEQSKENKGDNKMWLSLVRSEVGTALEGNKYVCNNTLQDREVYTFPEEVSEEVMAIISKSLEDFEEVGRNDSYILLRLKADIHARAKADFITLCNARYQEDIRSMEHTISEYASRIGEYERAIMDLINNRKRDRGRLEALKKTQVPSAEYERQFDQILKINMIEDVDVRNGRVSFDTKTVFIEHDDEIYEIGKLRISINTNQGASGISVSNLTHTEMCHAHPHVSSNGVCCFGNLGLGITKMITEHEFSAVMNVMIQFLTSYNHEDPYHHIENWPRRRKTRKLLAEIERLRK